VARRAEKPGACLRFVIIVLYPLTKLLWRVRWLHRERIPRAGAAIIALNHVSYADPIAVGRLIWEAGRNPRYLSKAGLFTMPVIGHVFRWTGQIPVYRGTSDAAEALRGAVEALDRGEMVLFYPEGTVTRDPSFWPMEPHTGIARLALARPDVPVIPIGQWGAQNWLDVYARRFRPFSRPHITASVGQPIDLSEFAGHEPTNEVLHEMSNKIMKAVMDEVAMLRGETAPSRFHPRPAGVGARASDAKTRRGRKNT
jgi:1-acyl-sn-glycerol-3-phosphate acyltransferase